MVFTPSVLTMVVLFNVCKPNFLLFLDIIRIGRCTSFSRLLEPLVSSGIGFRFRKLSDMVQYVLFTVLPYINDLIGESGELYRHKTS